VTREVLVEAIGKAKKDIEAAKRWLEWATGEIPKYERELAKGDVLSEKRSR
jgi:hypothetical protein